MVVQYVAQFIRIQHSPQKGIEIYFNIMKHKKYELGLV